MPNAQPAPPMLWSCWSPSLSSSPMSWLCWSPPSSSLSPSSLNTSPLRQRRTCKWLLACCLRLACCCMLVLACLRLLAFCLPLAPTAAPTPPALSPSLSSSPMSWLCWSPPSSSWLSLNTPPLRQRRTCKWLLACCLHCLRLLAFCLLLAPTATAPTPPTLLHASPTTASPTTPPELPPCQKKTAIVGTPIKMLHLDQHERTTTCAHTHTHTHGARGFPTPVGYARPTRNRNNLVEPPNRKRTPTTKRNRMQSNHECPVPTSNHRIEHAQT